MGGRTDGSTTDCWQYGRFYRGWATERVVEREVLLWIHGRTCGSTHKVILNFEVRLGGQNKVILVDFSLRNGRQNGW